MFDKKKSEEICLRYSFDERFKWKFISDVSYNVQGCGIIDVDRTTTIYKSTLYGNYFNSLKRYQEIANLSPKIESCVKKIDDNPSNVKRAFDELYLGTLRGVLKEEWHIDACLDAAAETTPPPKTREFLLDLRDRGIKRGLITFSVEDALVPWYNYRVGILGSYLRGIRLIFKNGVLVDYDLPEYGKVTFAKSFIDSLGFSSDDAFAIDDDPILDRSLILMLGIGFVVWVDENKNRRELEAKGLFKYPGKIYHVFPEAKQNMQMLTPLVDKWIRARAISNIKSPLEIIQMNYEFKAMRRSLERCKSERRDEKVKCELRNFMESTRKLFAIGYPIISTVLSGVEDLFSDLEIAFYRGEEAKNLVKQAEIICTTLYEENPEFQLTDDYLEEIKSCML